jgi:hypothetical protein
MTGLDDEVAKLHAQAERSEIQAEESRRRADERRTEFLTLQRQAAERLKGLQVGSRLIVLKPVRWFDSPDFGHDGSGWRRTSTQPRCWVLNDQTRYLTADSVDPVAELLLEDGQVVGISKEIYVQTSLRDVFAVSQMPAVLDYWPGTPYIQDPTVGKARELLAKLIVKYERQQAAIS